MRDLRDNETLLVLLPRITSARTSTLQGPAFPPNGRLPCAIRGCAENCVLSSSSWPE